VRQGRHACLPPQLTFASAKTFFASAKKYPRPQLWRKTGVSKKKEGVISQLARQCVPACPFYIKAGTPGAPLGAGTNASPTAGVPHIRACKE